MNIEDVRKYMNSLGFVDASLMGKGSEYPDDTPSYSLEEVKVNIEIGIKRKHYTKSVVICHVEDEAQVLYALWEIYTTTIYMVKLDYIDETEEMEDDEGIPPLPDKILFLSGQRHKHKLVSDAMAELFVPRQIWLSENEYQKCIYPYVECEHVGNIFDRFTETIKDITSEDIYIDDTARDYHDEKVKQFIIKMGFDIVFVDKFSHTENKAQ